MTLPEDTQKTLRAYYALLSRVKDGGEGAFLDPGMTLLLIHMGDGEAYHDDLRNTGFFGSNISYALAKLETLGFITGKSEDRDKRRKLYQRTEAGARVATAALARLKRETA